MTRSAIFFDRDNTLILNDGHLGDPKAVRLISGAADAVARARSLGFVVITASNQSGVARGMYPEEAVEAVNARMDELLCQENPGAIIDRHEFCPFHPEGSVEQYRLDSELRKPKPGMILRAADALDIDLPSSWLIGDAPRDIEAGRAAGCKTILINDSSVPPSQASGEAMTVDPDETVGSLAEAIDLIESAGAAEPVATATTRALNDLEASRRRLRQDAGLPEESDAGPRRNPVPKSPIDPQKPGADRAQAQAPLKVATNEPPNPPQRQVDKAKTDFSISKLLAGVVQTLALAVAVSAYFYHNGNDPIAPLLSAIFLQAFTIALLLMARDSQ